MADSPDSSQQCASFGKAAGRTVALAFELAGDLVTGSPDLIAKTLKDEQFEKAVTDMLQKLGQTMMDEQVKGAPAKATDSITRLTNAGGKAALDKGEDALIKAVKTMPAYQQLQNSLKQLGCAFDRTGVGVFVNKNKTLLIIVGAVAAVGGAAAMYYTKSGDLVGTGAGMLLSGLEIKKVGKLTFKLNKLEFKPSERQVALEAGAKGDWEAVKAEFALAAAFKNDKFVGASGKAGVVIDLNPRTAASAEAAAAWARGDAGKPDTMSATLKVGVKQKLSSRSDLAFQIIGAVRQDPTGRKDSLGLSASYNLGQPLGPKTALSLVGSAEAGVMQKGLDSGGYGTAKDYQQVDLRVKLTW